MKLYDAGLGICAIIAVVWVLGLITVDSQVNPGKYDRSNNPAYRNCYVQNGYTYCD